MRRGRYRSFAAIIGLGLAIVATLLVWRAGQSVEQERWALLRTYCTDCHNSLDVAGDLDFEGLTPDSVPQHPEIFEAAISKLRGRLIPPPGGPQPEQSDIDSLISWLERSIDEGASHQLGRVTTQRLNRSEYRHAVKDLLGVDIDPTEYLPAEIEVDGFTNIAAALGTSPSFVEQYVSVASTVAHLAVGEPKPKVAMAYFPAPSEDQQGYIDGMPLGTRGGIKFTHIFPADGEYRLTLGNLGVGLYPRALETRHTLVVLVDRNEVFRADIGGRARPCRDHETIRRHSDAGESRRA